jgi:hypothetical protein
MTPGLRQRGQGPGDRAAECGVMHGQPGTGVKHDDVGRAAAERLGSEITFLLALAARGGEAATGLQRAEHPGAPHGRGDHHQRGDPQQQQPAGVNQASP